MAHKFAKRWHVFTLDNQTPPQLTDRGEMDLKTMDDNGNLANGSYHERPTTVTHTIQGSVMEVGDLTFLSLRHDDGTSRYRGILAKENGEKMKIVGSRFFPRSRTEDSKALLAQDEEPWIITKP